MVELARYLIELRESLVAQIGKQLTSSGCGIGKQGVSYPPRHKDRLLPGRFKATHSKISTYHGKESLERLVKHF